MNMRKTCVVIPGGGECASVRPWGHKPRYCNANSRLCDGKSCFQERLGWGFLQNPIFAQACRPSVVG